MKRLMYPIAFVASCGLVGLAIHSQNAVVIGASIGLAFYNCLELIKLLFRKTS